MGVDSKNSSDLDMGRRPKLKSDEFFESTPISSRDNRAFVLETAQKSGAVIGGATRAYSNILFFWESILYAAAVAPVVYSNV